MVALARLALLETSDPLPEVYTLHSEKPAGLTSVWRRDCPILKLPSRESCQDVSFSRTDALRLHTNCSTMLYKIQLLRPAHTLQPSLTPTPRGTSRTLLRDIGGYNRSWSAPNSTYNSVGAAGLPQPCEMTPISPTWPCRRRKSSANRSHAQLASFALLRIGR